MKTAYELRFLARQHIGENFRRIILASIVVTLVLYGLSLLSSRTSGIYDWAQENYSEAQIEKMNAWMEEYTDAVSRMDEAALDRLASEPPYPAFPKIPTAGIIITALLELASAAISAGYSGFFLLRARGVDAGIRDIFPSFRSAVRIVVINLLVSVIVGLGFALFIVPGVILLYRYRLVYYVMFDNPDMGIFACLRESGRLMKGQKWRLFRLDISFIGWILLSALVSLLFFPLLDIWLTPYMELARAYFYTDLVPNGAYGSQIVL